MRVCVCVGGGGSHSLSLARSNFIQSTIDANTKK